MTDLHRLTLAELNEGLRARHFSSVELARHFLARIERFNPALNAFITVTAEQALAAAQKADTLLAAGARRAATAAADPPDEPPGTFFVSHGLRTGPYQLFSFEEPIANSSMFVLPSITTPAWANRSTIVAS